MPIGIGNSDLAMPKGAKIPKPLRIRVVVGEPLAPPDRSEGGRVSRSRVHATTDELRSGIQPVYDEAAPLSAGGRSRRQVRTSTVA